jgi:orotidine-5'-phosphate decarboxylase
MLKIGAIMSSLEVIRKKIIVALDVPTEEEALKLVDRIKDQVGMFKVGLELFTRLGPSIVQKIRSQGASVFLDLKFYDIPNTVAAAVRQVVQLDVQMLTLHAAGGGEMIQAAKEAAEREAKKRGVSVPKILGVTVLTSFSDTQEKARPGILPGFRIDKMVHLMAKMAEKQGCDGVVSSLKEVAGIREVCEKGFLIVTPGIRLPGEPSDDQKRVATPREAIKEGVDYLVIGRTITRSPDPLQAVKKVLDQAGSISN